MFLLFAAVSGFAETNTTEPFPGVRLTVRSAQTPNPLAWYVVEIALDTPGLRFETTAPNGDGPRDTWTETTRAYVARTGAQLGINLSFFTNDTAPHTDVLGLAVSNGVRYSAWSKGLPCGFNISRENQVRIIERAEPNPAGYKTEPPVTLFNAAAGNVRLVRDGKNVGSEESARHPRTAIGVTRDNKLLLVVVDGRNPHHSIGVNYRELGEIMIEAGAVDAVNMDGGGSSTLVIADPEPHVVNIPMPMDWPEDAPKPAKGIERAVGNSLAVFLPAPKASAE